jgi:hypothetical protein
VHPRENRPRKNESEVISHELVYGVEGQRPDGDARQPLVVHCPNDERPLRSALAANGRE